ncbi:MAG: tyrosine-type recombinase/integrase [Solirubrobacteraceae bacterium]|jgi:integrase
MSVHRNRVGGYDVRWRAAGQLRSRSFRRKRDAERFDLQVKDAKQTGMLARVNGGAETLDEYVEQTWAPIHVAPLSPKTRTLYVSLYDGHISPTLGRYALRDLTPEIIGRWQADRIASGAAVERTRKSLTLLGGILQRAVEAGRIPSNPQRLVRKAPALATEEVRPLAPATVERIREALRAGAGRDSPSTRHDLHRLRERDAVMVSLLAYAGLRPQEMRELCWGHVQERTLVVHAPKTRRHRAQPRTVRLLAPLVQDLREWRLACGRPGERLPVIPALNGEAMSENAFEMWRSRAWTAALQACGAAYQRPYDLRHSFASLLLHEGRSVIYVARQLGHGAGLTMRTYGHVIDELEDAPRIRAEDAIMAARRGENVRTEFG